MAKFYFPLLFWIPTTSDPIESKQFALHPRRWEVSIFDLYTLVAEQHPLRMSAELMQIFLPKVNLEIVIDASGHEEASEMLDTLRAMLYLQGMAPTVAPFATSHSLNEYAGINSRESGSIHESLPLGMRSGITSKESRIEGWPFELSFHCLVGDEKTLSSILSADVFLEAAEAAQAWRCIEVTHPAARMLRAALAKAPLMPDLGSSILHMWQALENLCGVRQELTFRLSLLLAELSAPVAAREQTYFDAKKSYGERSKIAHGAASLVDAQQWMRARGLLVKTVQSILLRGTIPTEDELFSELLSRQTPSQVS